MGFAHRVSHCDRRCRAFAGQKNRTPFPLSHEYHLRCRLCPPSKNVPNITKWRSTKTPYSHTPCHLVSSRVSDVDVVSSVSLCRWVMFTAADKVLVLSEWPTEKELAHWRAHKVAAASELKMCRENLEAA